MLPTESVTTWSLSDLWAGDRAQLVPAASEQRAVRIALAGLAPESFARAGDPDGLGSLRAAVTSLVDQGVSVELELVLGGTAEELVASLLELGRLALRHPGKVIATARLGQEPDAWVRVAAVEDLLVEERLFTASLERLRERWLAHHETLDDGSEEWRRGERLLRHLDDAPRRLIFGMLEASWRRSDPGWTGEPPNKETALQTAVELLGEHERWVKAFRQYTYETAIRRLVVIPTWQCELRCSYCFIPKQDGRVMSAETLERSIDMLLDTEQPLVWLQFFGGEALLEYELVQHGIVYGMEQAARVGKEIRFVVSSNGWSLTAEALAWLAQYPVRLELSLDGDRWTQERYRASRWRGQSSYDDSIARNAKEILASGLEEYVIMVVHPTNVHNMPANFFHIADLGFRHIQINNMLGRLWTEEQTKIWADGLMKIGRELERRWAAGEALEFINMRHRPTAMRLNGEITIDHDGTIFGGNGFLHETEHKDKFVLSHLDACTNIDRYWVDATDNNFLLDWSYRPRITANNVEVGKVMASFCAWMRKRGFGPGGPGTDRPAPDRVSP